MRIVKTTGFSLLAMATLFIAGPVLAGMPAPRATSIPTLGEWGWAGIAALLAVAAGRALHGRKR
jgi:hypothetical protein